MLGLLALLLTSAGIYGVVAYTTRLRAKELGIRVALGAGPRRIVAVVLRNTMAPLCVGIAISLIAAVLLARLLASLLYEISSSDPVTYVGVGALLLAIGSLATIGPARRAAGDDPLPALREQATGDEIAGVTAARRWGCRGGAAGRHRRLGGRS